jgi:hypothetical protein
MTGIGDRDNEQTNGEGIGCQPSMLLYLLQLQADPTLSGDACLTLESQQWVSVWAPTRKISSVWGKEHAGREERGPNTP